MGTAMKHPVPNRVIFIYYKNRTHSTQKTKKVIKSYTVSHKKQAKLRQTSTKSDNFQQKDGKQSKII